MQLNVKWNFKEEAMGGGSKLETLSFVLLREVLYAHLYCYYPVWSCVVLHTSVLSRRVLYNLVYRAVMYIVLYAPVWSCLACILLFHFVWSYIVLYVVLFDP